ncbi:formyltransferase family protein [uncultured Lamprocystis sp.]|jgi:methionyl-tRNA formyltransferase|uniref:formyltransferase family protein n=1 Tax=uncultured Lamprocystis sp. TaxID=543132 RepID=UPI0025F46F22|nr:formyltransferase family protein [uncultured Lamprocystis sp.]
MRIVFIGAVEFSLRTLQHLGAIGASVVGVCTLRQSAFNADHVDLSGHCAEHGIPCIHTEDIHAPAALEWIAGCQPDVIFCFGWSRLLRKPVLELAPLGVVGFHPAALPRNRGRHPIIWALVLGLSETASTFFFMDEGADSGDILSQRSIVIDPQDDARSLYDKVVATALQQIGEFVPQLAAHANPRIPQDVARSNSWRKRGRADGLIDWRMSASSIHNLVRGLTHPYVGAEFQLAGQTCKVWKSRVVAAVPANIEPGKVIGHDEARKPIIKCGEEALCLVETEPEFAPVCGAYL